jgi:hypothetical protein
MRLSSRARFCLRFALTGGVRRVDFLAPTVGEEKSTSEISKGASGTARKAPGTALSGAVEPLSACRGHDEIRRTGRGNTAFSARSIPFSEQRQSSSPGIAAQARPACPLRPAGLSFSFDPAPARSPAQSTHNSTLSGGWAGGAGRNDVFRKFRDGVMPWEV